MGEDELRVDALKANVKNMRTELHMYNEQIQNLNKFIEFTEREIELKKKLLPIVTKHNKRLRPSYEFEEKPEFLAIQSELDELSIEKALYDLQLKIKRYNHQLNNALTETARLESHLPEAEKQLTEAEGELHG